MKKSKKKSVDFIKLMFIVAFCGIIILGISFYAIYSIVFKTPEKPQNIQPQDNISSTTDKNEDRPYQLKKVFGIIMDMDFNNNSISVRGIEDGEKANVIIGSIVDIKDQYGDSIVFNELSIGDFVDIKYNALDNQVESLKVSAESWHKEEVQNAKIDLENNMLQLYNNQYSIAKSPIVLYRGKPYDLSKVTENEMLELSGYRNDVYVIKVVKGHGYVKIHDYEDYVSGTIDIGKEYSGQVEEQMEVISVTEGLHKVVIDKEGVEPFMQDAMVASGETADIIIGPVKSRIGKVEFKIDEGENTELYINDESYPLGLPISLEYGSYDIRVKAKGMQDYVTKLVVNQPEMILAIKLDSVQKFLHVETVVKNVEVYVDDNFMGYSPVSVPIAEGEHTILLIKDGYKPLRQKFMIGEKDFNKYFSFAHLEKESDDNSYNTVDPNNSNESNNNTDNTGELIPAEPVDQNQNIDTSNQEQGNTQEGNTEQGSGNQQTDNNQGETPIDDIYKED